MAALQGNIKQRYVEVPVLIRSVEKSSRRLGSLEETRAALVECERLNPDFVKRRTDWQPYPDQISTDHLRDGLRKAGLADRMDLFSIRLPY